MKIFLDTANINEIKEALSWGVLDGVTTNPTLISKEGKDLKTVLGEIFEVVKGPVSVECTHTQAEDLIIEAREIAKIAPNVVVKIQATKEGLKAINVVSKEGIKVNTTLIFSANQALLAAKAGTRYVSPFIGRLDDIGNEGMQVVRDIVDIFKAQNIKTEVLVSSIRHPIHVIDAAKTGAQIATMPFAVLEKMIQHSLTDKGLKQFLDDWEKVKQLSKQLIYEKPVR